MYEYLRVFDESGVPKPDSTLMRWLTCIVCLNYFIKTNLKKSKFDAKLTNKIFKVRVSRLAILVIFILEIFMEEIKCNR